MNNALGGCGVDRAVYEANTALDDRMGDGGRGMADGGGNPISVSVLAPNMDPRGKKTQEHQVQTPWKVKQLLCVCACLCYHPTYFGPATSLNTLRCIFAHQSGVTQEEVLINTSFFVLAPPVAKKGRCTRSNTRNNSYLADVDAAAHLHLPPELATRSP